MGRIFFIFGMGFLFLSSPALAQSPAAPEKQGIYAIIRDAGGETAEGYLRLGPDELTLQSKDRQEKTVPVKYIKSITLEMSKDWVPGGDPKREPTYNVQLQNSQEIYTLRKKYSFSLNTNLGVITKTIDPEQVNRLFSRDQSPLSQPGEEKTFIQDSSIVFSLEFKF